jgi:hypothetical protein
LVALLKRLLAQLVQTGSIRVDDIYREFSESGKLAFQSLETLMRLTETVLEHHSTSWIILDGIDECSRKERKRIITWALQLSKSPSLTNIRVLFISQDEGDLRSLLVGVPSISLMEQLGHLNEIRVFASRKVRRLREKYGFSEELETEIIDKVVQNADGEGPITSRSRDKEA